MAITDSVRNRIETYLQSDRVVLFMKGTPQQPMCGFSAKTAGILDGLVGSYTTVNVLADEEIRQGIKDYGQWPTIPQLYIDQELVGGCDIVTDMYESGELHRSLGLPEPDRTPPTITITDNAAEQIRIAMAEHPETAVFLSVDAQWEPGFSLRPVQGGEIATEANGIRVLMDVNTAPRARGAVIDWQDGPAGSGLTIDLPEAPAPVKMLLPTELKQRLDSGEELLLVDVRQADERAKAAFPGAETLDQESLQRLQALPSDTPLVFICHHGRSSMGAAQHFRKRGFTQVFNLEGGIDAWSQQVDPSIPRY
ncbi:MAG: Grx4 family monothiol glutaredoxin [Wenzhouxiangellaceae bacterium]